MITINSSVFWCADDTTTTYKHKCLTQILLLLVRGTYVQYYSYYVIVSIGSKLYKVDRYICHSNLQSTDDLCSKRIRCMEIEDLTKINICTQYYSSVVVRSLGTPYTIIIVHRYSDNVRNE